MEEKTGTCFITDKECVVTEIIYEGKEYLVSEDLADEFPLKKIKTQIAEKITAEEEKKKQALEVLKSAAAALNIDPAAMEALIIGGQRPAPAEPATEASAPKQNQLKSLRKPKKEGEDNGFKEVDGNLKADFQANVNLDEGVGAGMPGYSSVHGEDGRLVKEEGKRVKKKDNALVSESNMGKTVVRIDHHSGYEIDKMIKQIDAETKELLRPAITGRGHLSGIKTVECSLCRGSGITRVGEQKCPKCDGTGFLTA